MNLTPIALLAACLGSIGILFYAESIRGDVQALEPVQKPTRPDTALCPAMLFPLNPESGCPFAGN
jgi:hypothetical protein